jgi:probable addiction module antidote protein
MPKRTQSYNSWRESKLTDPTTAASYLTAAMSDSPNMFRKALRNVAQARQMAKVARDAGVTRESLYRATSEMGNPTLDTLESVLSALDINIKFEANASVVAPTPPISVPGPNVMYLFSTRRTGASRVINPVLNPTQTTAVYIGHQTPGSGNIEYLFGDTGILTESTLPASCAIVTTIETGIAKMIPPALPAELTLPAYLSGALLARTYGRQNSTGNIPSLSDWI